jgi:hypothetical protein
LEKTGILEILVTIFSGSSGNHQTAKEKFGNRITGIVYSTLAVINEQQNRSGKNSGKGKKEVAGTENEERMVRR